LTLIELIGIENIWRNIVSIGLLGNKIGMTQIFDESGNIIPVTILKVGPCVITQVKTTLKDGYEAIQIGYGNVSSKSLTQPELGHLQKSNLQPLKYLKEFHIDTEKGEFEVGQVLNVDSFTPGQLVNIRGKSIGKGFSGLQKRHNFSRGPMTHGSKKSSSTWFHWYGYNSRTCTTWKKNVRSIRKQNNNYQKTESYSSK
jgi:large subunit ribosomal protein L3